jgi:hypothetical protein
MYSCEKGELLHQPASVHRFLDIQQHRYGSCDPTKSNQFSGTALSKRLFDIRHSSIAYTMLNNQLNEEAAGYL